MLTLRKLIELIGETHMDAELCVQMMDGHRNHQFSQLPDYWTGIDRWDGNPSQPQGRVTFIVYTKDARFVKERKST